MGGCNNLHNLRPIAIEQESSRTRSLLERSRYHSRYPTWWLWTPGFTSPHQGWVLWVGRAGPTELGRLCYCGTVVRHRRTVQVSRESSRPICAVCRYCRGAGASGDQGLLIIIQLSSDRLRRRSYWKGSPSILWWIVLTAPTLPFKWFRHLSYNGYKCSIYHLKREILLSKCLYFVIYQSTFTL